MSRGDISVSGSDPKEVILVSKSLHKELSTRRLSLRSDGNDGRAEFRQELENYFAEDNISKKQKAKEYDVFLCHNSNEKNEVKALGKRLKDEGYLPWLDEWNLRPGLSWQKALEGEITQIRSAAVIIGESGVGPWQEQEIESFLREFTKRQCPVIPIILPSCRQVPALPLFLGNLTWVDFRRLDPDPMKHLIWGITGHHQITSGTQLSSVNGKANYKSQLLKNTKTRRSQQHKRK